MHICYIGIGSNLATPVQNAKIAIAALKKLPQSHFVSCSKLYCSKPMGPSDQPDYINAVAQLNTTLEPLALLDALQQIELQQGRVRKAERWGPRTLDLDLLLYGQELINNERLRVPHYGIKQREFVLYPLSEIAPNLVFPNGESLRHVLQSCPLNGLQVHSDI
ncbi:MAG: 2-amino-4-hydroxy-6-hydroxymethyldihydropteridine diphosphokinase [Psychrobium sp.]|nr:2-amino-4-hydroxy-6-hydroxymethyldihydropteridine diphosphokinase [Psychrobium sp.]